MTIAEAIKQVESCHFTCEAGPLELNVGWLVIRELAKLETFLVEFEKGCTNTIHAGLPFNRPEDCPECVRAFVNAVKRLAQVESVPVRHCPLDDEVLALVPPNQEYLVATLQCPRKHVFTVDEIDAKTLARRPLIK